MKKVIVACGTGMATSSIISEKVREILDKNDIQYTLSQVQLSELEMYKGADLFITSMKLKDVYKRPDQQLTFNCRS